MKRRYLIVEMIKLDNKLAQLKYLIKHGDEYVYLFEHQKVEIVVSCNTLLYSLSIF